MRPQTITLICYREREKVEVEVEAYVKNNIALHRAIPDPARGWTLTHNNVVLAGPKRVNKQRALLWLERVAALPIAWDKDIYMQENLPHLLKIGDLLP